MPNTTFNKISFFILRIATGWLMFYAGLVKILNPAWSAEGYLKSAKTFSSFYLWLADSPYLALINLINEWALTLLGISLILGAFVRLSSLLGVVLMLLYYFPVLEFPKAGSYGFIVDEHIIYVLLLLFFATSRGGKIWGLDKLILKIPWVKKIV